jgi:hypothetical protein
MENLKDTRVPRGFVGRLAIAGILGAALVAFGFVGTAVADTITFTGQGTNQNGTCGSFEGAPPAPGGTQTWQFNLTGTDGPATMSATFSDGTTVSNVPDDSPHAGNVSKWFIVTDAGASVVSASATRPETGGNPQFVVSHCTAGGEPPPPTTGTSPTTTPGGGGGTEVGGITAQRPSAAVPVTSQPGFTG